MRVQVFGHTTVTVFIVVDVDVENSEEIVEQEIYEQAAEEFGGIQEFAGNGALDKLIGVEDEDSTISADEDVVWDDYTVEEN